MKKILFFTMISILVFGGFSAMAADPLEELLEEFHKEYNAIKPSSQYSSVNSDYKLGQAALGTLYTTKAIGLLYKQNQEILEKYDEMLRRYDKIIKQNREIIKILTSIAKSQNKRTRAENPELESGEWSNQ